jgi:membrane glycosyltransferase
MDQIMSELTVAGQRIGRISDASSPELLPPETPLDMPDQDFKTRGAGPQRLRRGYWVPRAAVFTGGLLVTAAFAHELYGVLALEQLTPIQGIFLVLSTIAFGWIALGSLNAALGFLPLFAGEKADTIDLPTPTGRASRTALLFPSITRSRRASPAPCRRSRSSCSRWAMPRPSTSSFSPTRARRARAPPRKRATARCAAACRE